MCAGVDLPSHLLASVYWINIFLARYISQPEEGGEPGISFLDPLMSPSFVTTRQMVSLCALPPGARWERDAEWWRVSQRPASAVLARDGGRWLLNVPTRAACISGTYLFRQVDALPLWDRSCISKLAISTGYSTLTPDQPVWPLSLWFQASGQGILRMCLDKWMRCRFEIEVAYQNLLSQPVAVRWHRTDQSDHYPCGSSRLAG